MKFCTECGTQLHDNARFCTKCGCAVSQHEPQEETINSSNNIKKNNTNTKSANTMTDDEMSIFKKRFSYRKLVITITSVILCVIIVGIVLPLFNVSPIERKVNNLLKDDLNTSVKIIKLYYNEEKQGCFVEFKTTYYIEKAAIHIDTGIIDYESEFNYYVEKAEVLRKQEPINQSELHECNQKILNSSYSDWNFAIVVFEANGRPEESDWERIK